MEEQDITNGCTNPKTFELLARLQASPHAIGWMVFPQEEDEVEIVSVTFQHYLQIMTVDFNSETGVGVVIVHDPDNLDDIESGTSIGCITVDKFEALLQSLPHIDYYMEEEGLSETLH